MSDYNRILVVVDPTESDDQVCVDRGARLAEEFETGLELLICYYEQLPVGIMSYDQTAYDRIRQDAISEQRKKLERIAEPLRARGIDVVVTATWEASLQDGIIHHVLRTAPKLVVKDTHYHNAISRAILTHTDWDLLRDCPAPLWLGKQHRLPSKPVVLACVDPTHVEERQPGLDSKILQHAVEITQSLGGDLHVFHSYLPPMAHPYTYAEATVAPGTDYEEKTRSHHQTLLDEALEGHSVARDRVHLRSGTVAQTLTELTEELHASVVVMGAISRNAISRVLVGNTTEKVLHKLSCDMLVVKPVWFESKLRPCKPVHYEGTRESLPDGPGT